MSGAKRGPYKEYLFKNSYKKLPKTTRNNWKKKYCKNEHDNHRKIHDIYKILKGGEGNDSYNSSDSDIEEEEEIISDKETMHFLSSPSTSTSTYRSSADNQHISNTDDLVGTNETEVDENISESDYEDYIYTNSDDSCVEEDDNSDIEVHPFPSSTVRNNNIDPTRTICLIDENNEDDNDGSNFRTISNNAISTVDECVTKSTYSKDVLIRTLLVLGIKLRDNLNNQTTQHISELFDIASSTPLEQTSIYHIKKIIDSLSTPIIIHHMCPLCHKYAGKHFDEDNTAMNSITCQNCHADIDSAVNKTSGNIFLYLSLSDQLVKIFSRYHTEIIQENRRNKNCDYAIEDIMDGKLYKQCMNTETSEGYISLNFSIDGTPIFDSSPTSIVPLLCTINELPPRKRQQHIMLVGVYIGKSKPNIDEFLVPFVEETKQLYNDGFKYKYLGVQYIKKCKILIGISDSVERPDLRGSKTFRGMYGCGLCKHKGKEIAKDRGSVRVYPIDKDGNAYGQGLRTHIETLAHARYGEKGIKRRSVLCDIPEFNIIENLPADWMHCVTLGVCRQFLTLWFHSKYHREPHYIGRNIVEINNLLTSIKPSTDIARTPRKLSDRKYWKAHELVIWLLFYSLPVLYSFLPNKYVQHWSLLVEGVSILLKNSIVIPDVYYAQQCLFQFVDGVNKLYGEKHVSFNVHLLTHLAQGVLNWGPLWTHSAFCYENNHQKMKKMVHSSNSANLQICETFRSRFAFDKLLETYKHSLTVQQLRFLDRTIKVRKSIVAKRIIGNVGLLGKPVFQDHLDNDIFIALQRINVTIDANSLIMFHNRIIIGTEVIHSQSYNKVIKRNSYTVKLNNNELFHIDRFIVVSVMNDSHCFALGKYFKKIHNTFFPGKRLEHMIFLNCRYYNDSLAAVNVNMINEKVTLVHIDSRNPFDAVACLRPNKLGMLT